MHHDPRITIRLRVRYNECDPMGVAHHTAYPTWFEIGRTELCRAAGLRYRDLEEQGYLLVVAKLAVAYRRPTRYDDEIDLETTLSRSTRVRLEHDYRLTNVDGVLLATASTTLACLDRDGRPQEIPDFLRLPEDAD